MPDVDTLSFLVNRLTPQQRAVLANLAELVDLLTTPDDRLSAWWRVEPFTEVDIAEGLCRLGLFARHPDMRLRYPVTLLGLEVFAILTDTGMR